MRRSSCARNSSHRSPAVRLKLDENLPAELADDLAALGHDVDTVQGEGLTGAADTRVAVASCRSNRVLLTLDKGLGDIRRFPPRRYPGIVLFRLEKEGTSYAALFPKARISLARRQVVVRPSSIRTS